MIISIGYKVNSICGTQFRIWANQILKEYLSKGYAIDQNKFKEQSSQLEELKQTVRIKITLEPLPSVKIWKN